jgi:deazaflavin-dependent oxidoreductase (nitroreductase family)
MVRDKEEMGMPEKVGKGEPPKGFNRLMFRAPIWLYRLGLGGVLGKRFLLLKHTGRKSGLPRQTVLEVVDYNETSNTYYIASGYGEQSDWYKNIRKIPDVTIQVGRKESAVTAVPLTPDESGQAMVKYAHRHPKAAKELMRLCGYKVTGSEEDYFIVGRDIIPFIALEPKEDKVT